MAEALVESLRHRSALLVLDNFEQVVDAAPDSARLLQGAPGLKELATSRVRRAKRRAMGRPPL